MNELLRHIWMYGMQHSATVWLVAAILALVAVGSVISSGLSRNLRLRFWEDDALLASTILAVLMTVLLVLTAVIPNSPLRGVTGTLIPSPWLTGLFPALCTLVVTVSIVYGLLSGYINSMRRLISVLTYGISRWPWIILIAMFIRL